MDEEDIKQIQWEEIRDYYSDKKERWAKGKSYYQGNPEWGTLSVFGGSEPAGYSLKPPYSIEEVRNYEDTLKIKLPEDLFSYLTTISREILRSSYPMVFSLNATSKLEEEFRLPPEKDYWSFSDCLVHGNYPQLPEPHTKENNYGSCDCDIDWTGGMVSVGEGGCTDTDLIVIKGTCVGTIWCVGSGGDSLHKSYDSLWDYIYSPIAPPIPSTPPSLVELASAYNFLRIMGGVGGLSYNN
jgi:hypothetical protein